MSLKGFITELDLNNKQKTACSQHAGSGRFAYNWAIDLMNETRVHEIYWSAVDLHKHWVATFKKENKWVKGVSKWSPQEAFRNLEDAMKRFWEYKRQIKGQKVPLEKLYKKKILLKAGKKYTLKPEWNDKYIPLNLHYKFPNFKKKNILDKFYLEGNKKLPIIIDKKRIKLPKIGWVKTHETMPSVTPKNVTISLQSGKWFISFKREIEHAKPEKKKGKTGVDIGLKVLATFADGTTFPSTKRYKELQKKLARLQRSQARQRKAYEERVEKGLQKETKEVSKNYQKTRLLIQKVHYEISCLREDSLHKLTTYAAKNHDEVTIEDLNVNGMMKNKKLARALANGSFFELRRQLEYKCELYGTKLIIADRFFASSKTCCCCGHKQDMPLKKRIFDCEKCPNKMDRDLNAAINLMNYNGINYAGSQSVKACGDAKVQDVSSVSVDEAGMKQKTVSIDNCEVFVSF